MSRKQAYVYFYASYCDKTHQIHDSDTFQLRNQIPDINNLFATLIRDRVRSDWLSQWVKDYI